MWIFIILMVGMDQLTKILAIKYLQDSPAKVLIDNFFQFTYVENRGAAFGILQDKKIFFIVITSLVILAIVFFIYRNYKTISFLEKLSLTMILGGAIGNFVDRIFRGYVVDFISFQFWDYYFPVFNIADIFIVLGTGLLIILLLFEEYL